MRTEYVVRCRHLLLSHGQQWHFSPPATEGNTAAPGLRELASECPPGRGATGLFRLSNRLFADGVDARPAP
jgi:hypothetical protein